MACHSAQGKTKNSRKTIIAQLFIDYFFSMVSMLNKSIHETLLEKFPQAFKKTDRKRALEALFLTSITNETSVLFAEPLISDTKKRNPRLIS